MLVIVENPYNHRKYKLAPYESGECFKLYVSPLPGAKNKKGDPVSADWLFTGKYPLTINDGLSKIWNMILCDTTDEREVDLKDLKDLIKRTRSEVIKTITMKDLM